jgi:hypothetical protein
MAKNTDYYGEAVMTPEFRAAFANVFEPKEFNGKKKYTITMLFPKGTDLSELKREAEKVALAYFKGKLPANFKNPFKNGDLPNSQGNVFDGFPGHTVVNAWTGEDSPPKIVDQNVKKIIDRAEFKSGDYAHAKVTPFAYNTQGNTGVSFFLGNIQKIKTGEPFGAQSNPEDDFNKIASSEDPNEYENKGNSVFDEEAPVTDDPLA